jgi:hypothetical protein
MSETTGVTEQATAATGEDTQAAAAKTEDVQGQNTIPQERLNAEIEKTKAAKAEAQAAMQMAEMAKQQAELFRANAKPVEQERDIYAELGLSQYDTPNVEQQKLIDKFNEQKMNDKFNAMQVKLNEIGFVASNPDAPQKINSLKETLTENPRLANALAGVDKNSQLAVAVAIAEVLEKQSGKVKVDEVQKAIDKTAQDASKPLTLAAAGGSGTSPKTELQRVQGMSSAEIRAKADRIAASG